MGSNARLGHDMHRFGAHLEFDVGSERPNQRCVQRLIPVDFRNRDVVFKFSGQWLVLLMHDAHSGVAVVKRRNNDPKTIKVSHLSKRKMLVIHLLVNGIKRFLSSRNLYDDFF